LPDLPASRRGTIGCATLIPGVINLIISIR
jgi:hypothetical protein